MKIEVNATDIIDHLPFLAEISKECSHITEMGVRDCVSTWAFVEGLGNKGELVSIDRNDPPAENLEQVKKLCEQLGIKFTFIKSDTREIEIAPTDMLFIDTDHTYEQLMSELSLHHEKVKKYIVMHDTESSKEMWKAIGNLIAWGGWKVKVHYQNLNGLTVLERY